MARSPAGGARSGNGTAKSFHGLRGAQRLERIDVRAIGEGEEDFFVRSTMREVGLEHAFDLGRRILRLHVVIELAAECSVGSEAAAGEDVIALDRVAII